MNVKSVFVGFDAVKKAVSIVRILERYGLMEQLHRSGDSLSGACPIHAGHNKAQFRVSISKNCWICFGDCHTGGSIIDFVSRKEGIGIRDAALLIQDWFGLGTVPGTNAGRNGSFAQGSASAFSVQQQPGEKAANPPMRQALTHLDKTHPYLVARGLSQETIDTFGVGYCRQGSLAGWIAIPVHNAVGELVAYAGRWPGEPVNGFPKYQLPRGFRKSLELYNLHRAKAANAARPLLVVEGYFGCMKVWQAGLQKVVSTMGSMVSQRQAELIAETTGASGTAILLFDEDEAGRKGRRAAWERLNRHVRVHVIRFPDEGTQPDDLEPEALRELVQKAAG